MGGQQPGYTPQDATNTMLQNGQNMNNALALYQQMQQAKQGGAGNFGKAPQGMSQSEWNGLCQAFVEQQTYGHTGIFPSAIAAWNAQQKNARTDLQNAKPGDLIYFAPDKSNGGYGHTGIYTGNGNFTSATYNGVQNNSLKDWVNTTHQRILGYIPVQH